MKRFFRLSLLILLPLLLLSVYSCEENHPKTTTAFASRLQQITINLDGLTLTLTAPSLPNQFTFLPDSQDPIQTANFLNQTPAFESLTLTAIPFRTRIGTEAFPAAGPGLVNAYREYLSAFRNDQGGFVQEGPMATLFSETVTGILSTVEIYLDTDKPSPVHILEWVVEAGNRIWLVRFSQEIVGIDGRDGEDTTEALRAAWAELNLASSNLDIPSLSIRSMEHPGEIQPLVADSDLPFPSWWSGDCDKNTYYNATGIWAYPLGGSYRGVKACGPRPWADDAPDVLVQFFPGSWGALEWQCVELSMRFLYLAYGVAPYKANGNQVVTNYSGTRLVKISNGTVGTPPKPGDVISTGPETTYGHTAVISATNVDGNGNGSVTAVEQNASSTGIRTYSVINWVVTSSTTVIGWLHDPASDQMEIFLPWMQ
jgi:hypothetical protein